MHNKKSKQVNQIPLKLNRFLTIYAYKSEKLINLFFNCYKFLHTQYLCFI